MAKVKADLLARESDGDLSLIEGLSDLIRLTIDAMHDELSICRILVVTMSNPTVKDTLHETEPNEFLFGKTLTEKLKQANILGKETQILLKKSATSHSLKNPKAPPRQNQNKSHTRICVSKKGAATTIEILDEPEELPSGENSTITESKSSREAEKQSQEALKESQLETSNGKKLFHVKN